MIWQFFPTNSPASRHAYADLCSHRRSWWFWADSVRSADKAAFHSAKAKSWEDFKKGRIDESTIVNMGIDCLTT